MILIVQFLPSQAAGGSGNFAAAHKETVLRASECKLALPPEEIGKRLSWPRYPRSDNPKP